MISAPMVKLTPNDNKEIILKSLGLPENAKYCAIIGRLFKMHPTFDEAIFRILSSTADNINVYIVMVAEEVGDINRHIYMRLQNNTLATPKLIERIRLVDYSKYVDVILHAECILDTFPYGGCLTAHDAMANGIPIVTLPLEHVRGRYAFGMYRQMGHLDLVAQNITQYSDLVVHLISDSLFREKHSMLVRKSFDEVLHKSEAVAKEWTYTFKLLTKAELS